MASQALRKAGFTVKRSIQQSSPTSKSKKSWTLRSRGAGVIIQSRDVGAIMTDRNSHHPLFGDRDRMYFTNQNHPDRTGFIDRGTDAALNRATDEYADGQTKLILKRYGF